MNLKLATIPFEIVAGAFFPTTFLETAVYSIFYIAKNANKNKAPIKRSKNSLNICWAVILRCAETMPYQTASIFREQKKCWEDVETKRVSSGLNIDSQQMLRECWDKYMKWMFNLVVSHWRKRRKTIGKMAKETTIIVSQMWKSSEYLWNILRSKKVKTTTQLTCFLA